MDLKKHVSPHGRVTAVSMMKDEAPYLLEWFAHHLAVGFTDILVYTNDCTDGTDDMLAERFAQGQAFTATADGMSLAAYEQPAREAAQGLLEGEADDESAGPQSSHHWADLYAQQA